MGGAARENVRSSSSHLSEQSRARGLGGCCGRGRLVRSLSGRGVGGSRPGLLALGSGSARGHGRARGRRASGRALTRHLGFLVRVCVWMYSQRMICK